MRIQGEHKEDSESGTLHYDVEVLRDSKEFDGVPYQNESKRREILGKSLEFDAARLVNVVGADAHYQDISKHTHGHITIFGDSHLRDSLDYLLSEERKFNPTHVTCSNSAHYGFINHGLKQVRGRNARLKKGFIRQIAGEVEVDYGRN
jgi:hypothetical protein